jgi:hypothetical protein
MRALNIIGLILNVIAAIFLAFRPPRVEQWTKEGGQLGPWVGTSTPQGKQKGTRQALLSRLGPWFLAAGFFLQLIAASFG